MWWEEKRWALQLTKEALRSFTPPGLTQRACFEISFLHGSKTTRWTFTLTLRAQNWIIWEVGIIFEVIYVAEMLTSFAPLCLGATTKDSTGGWGLCVHVGTLKHRAARTPASFASGWDALHYSELREGPPSQNISLPPSRKSDYELGGGGTVSGSRTLSIPSSGKFYTQEWENFCPWLWKTPHPWIWKTFLL